MARKRLNIGNPSHRELVSWIGGGIAVIAAGAFAVVKYIVPPRSGEGGTNCAENASIAAQGDVSHVTISANGGTLQATGKSACGSSDNKKP